MSRLTTREAALHTCICIQCMPYIAYITYIRTVHHSCTLNCQYSFYRQDESMCCETPLFATLFAMAYYNLAALKTIDCANICRDKIINISVTTDLLILTRNNWTAVNIPTKGKGPMISSGFENQDIEDDLRETALTLIDYQCLSNTNGPYHISISTLGPHNGFCACEGIQTRSRDLWQSDRWRAVSRYKCRPNFIVKYFHSFFQTRISYIIHHIQMYNKYTMIILKRWWWLCG